MTNYLCLMWRFRSRDYSLPGESEADTIERLLKAAAER